MSLLASDYLKLCSSLPESVSLVAVSKKKTLADIRTLYEQGQRDFGENYVQELLDKQGQLPAEIRWHFIGHLQRNKVKAIVPFVHMIQSVDSFKLLLEINKQAAAIERRLDVLLQVHIAEEETKFGLDEKEVFELLEYFEAQKGQLQHVRICGLLGMGTATNDEGQTHKEFARLHALFLNLKAVQFLGQDHFSVCSMGMSGDYKIAISEGSNMLRIGSLIFGLR
ncbi:MAG: YggS family pyridoxal phosphate-dependent enzyme [Bacteroidetes bacterium]|nr:YggS family pyridoxal phosphate-dependent enzyme [Bacteroidota bacterium]